jgi:hypothetical protein
MNRGAAYQQPYTDPGQMYQRGPHAGARHGHQRCHGPIPSMVAESLHKLIDHPAW